MSTDSLIPTADRPVVGVRRATPDDAAEVTRMVREIAEHEDALHAVHVTEDGWRDLLVRPTVVVLLAEVDGRAAGYVSAVRQLSLWLGRDILALDDLYVRERHRNAGVGGDLMTALARIAAQERLLIRWEVLEDNHAAQRFYARLGATLRTKVIATWGADAYGARG